MLKRLAPARRVLHDADVAIQRLTADQRNSFIAALLGWTMDAFDYFIVVLVYADIAKTFHLQDRRWRSSPRPPWSCARSAR